jgi:hypothetical protein
MQRVLFDHGIKLLFPNDRQLMFFLHFSPALLDAVNQGDKTAWNEFTHDMRTALFQIGSNIVDKQA